MAIQKLAKNRTFTTTSADYDLLQDTAIKTAIQEFFGWDETKYQAQVGYGLKNMKFTLFCSGTEVKINDFEYDVLIEDAVYDSEDFVRYPIKSIKIKDTAITGTINFNFA